MADYLVSYDLRATTPSPYSAMKDRLAANGFYRWTHPAPGKWPHLPNTTARGSYPDMDSARAAFAKAQSEAAKDIDGIVDVEKIVIVEHLETYLVTNENSDD